MNRPMKTAWPSRASWRPISTSQSDRTYSPVEVTPLSATTSPARLTAVHVKQVGGEGQELRDGHCAEEAGTEEKYEAEPAARLPEEIEEHQIESEEGVDVLEHPAGIHATDQHAVGRNDHDQQRSL